MNYEKIIIEMLDRIKVLEEKVEMLEKNGENANNYICSQEEKGNLTQKVRDYIIQCKCNAKEQGKKEIILLCNDIQKKFGVVNRAPAICSAMYDCMCEKDEILFAPPSGKSTTVKIKYIID